MLYNIYRHCHYSHNATGVAGGSLIPQIYCENLYTGECICGGHLFRASFLPKKMQQGKRIWLSFGVRVNVKRAYLAIVRYTIDTEKQATFTCEIRRTWQVWQHPDWHCTLHKQWQRGWSVGEKEQKEPKLKPGPVFYHSLRTTHTWQCYY